MENKVWIIDRDWKGNFYALEVDAEEAKNRPIKTYPSKEEAEKGMSSIWVDQPYS